MQKVLVAQPGLGLAAKLALHAGLPLLRHQAAALREVLAEVLRHVAALGEDNGLLLLLLLLLAIAGGGGGGGGGRRRDDDDGGFAEGVDLFELRGCEELLVAVVELDVELDLELFEEPEDALGAGAVEPGGRGAKLERVSML